MIRSLKGKIAQAIADGRRPKGFPPDLVRSAQNKLAILDAAVNLADLRSPPGNRLHALTDDRRGQHAIAVNDQWRVCFRWTPLGPEDVEICDYH
jgi:proteic killer suppression protein